MEKGSERHIVVLRLSALGDVAISVPVLLALRRTHPEYTITFVTKAAYKAVVHRVPGVEVLEVDTKNTHKGLRGLYRLSQTLRKLQPDAIADLHSVLRTGILRIYLLFSGIPFVQVNKARAEKRALTRASGKDWKPLKPTYQRYASVFEELGLPLKPMSTDILPGRPIPAVFKDLIKEGKRLGLAPFAAHAGKCYPESSMRAVIELLQSLDGLHVYLFGGGKHEVETLREWEQANPNCTSVAGLAGLDEELDLISNLDLMVSMDSGNGHLAAMYGIPVITLWGVTHPYAGFAPFGQSEDHSLTADRTRFPAIPTSVYGNRVPEGYEKAMESIPPEMVYTRILETLGHSRADQARTTGERERK